MDDEEYTNQINIKDYLIYTEKNLSNQGLENDYLAVKNKKKYISKIILKDKIKKPQIKKLIDTLKIHRKIEHENLIDLYDYAEDSNYIYFFLKYIEGKTLKRILNDDNNYTFEESEIFLIIEQIVNLLIFFYENNIIVNDLTINNIYIAYKENNDKANDNYLVYLCNLEDSFLLSFNRKNNIESCYKKIIYKLGLLICKLLNKNFYFFLLKKKIDAEDEQNEDIISKYIKDNIFCNDKLSKYIKKFIVKTVLVKNDEINIKNIKEDKWFKHSYEKINSKKEKAKESLTNESLSSSCMSVSQIQDEKPKNSNKKKNFVEETIYTDEGYLELYQKEKEYLLGIIDYFDKDEILRKISESQKYMKYYYNYEKEELDNGSESTRRTEEESDKSIKENNKRRKRDKSKEPNKSIFKCYS